jgi:signal transduction histidine kinase
MASRLAGYVIAVALVLLGFSVSRAFGRIFGLEIYLLPFVSVLVASVVGGLGPGLLATGLAAVADYLAIHGLSTRELWLLMVEGTLISIVGGRLRRERLRVREQLEANLKLERQILEISDEVRRRIGHDLHDGLGQHLTGISLLSETIGQQLEAGEKPSKDNVETMTRLVSEAISITRDLAKSLSPVTLGREGLSAAIAELAESASSVLGISCVCESTEQLSLDRTRSLHIFRIVQEAVNNSVRHGKAKNVRIELRREGSLLNVLITDDGIGLSQKTSTNPGLGLRIMQYRATMLGAILKVTRTAPSGGTTVTCSCAVENPAGHS